MINEEKYFTITVLAECDMESPKEPTSNGFIFSVPRVMPRDSFFDEQGIPNEFGSSFITKLLVEALSGNIHMAHQKGYIDSAKHLRDAIDLLEDLFVNNCSIDVGFEDKKGWLKNKKQ